MSKEKYAGEFNDFLVRIYDKDGLEGIANCLPFVNGAFLVSLNGIVTAANNRFLELIGYEREEIYGRQLAEIILPEDQENLLRRLAESHPKPYAIRLLRHDGMVKYVTVSPNRFSINGRTYRLAEFIDNTSLVELQHKQILMLEQSANALTRTLEKRDPYTSGHMTRTAYIAVQIAKALKLDQATIESIFLGASIHDIGKISVPIEILTKPNKLEPHEWEFIKQHPLVGDEILDDLDCGDKVKQIVLSHHECQDGSGYPHGLTKHDIPDEVSIVSIADSLEAIASVRPYHPALSLTEAIEVMKSYQHKYHQQILSCTCSLVNSGELAY